MKVGTTTIAPFYAGAQLQYDGLDQINIILPHTLAGFGTLDVAVTVDSQPTNTVTLTIK